MSVSCELCREHLGEVLEAEIRQDSAHPNVASPNLSSPLATSANGVSVASTLPHDVESNVAELNVAELSDAELANLSSHVESCTQCAAQLAQMRAAHRVLRALPLQSAPEGLRERVRAQIAAAPVAAASAATLAIVPVRNSTASDNLWQRTQRGWSNVWNRPARTAWMGGSLAVGALGIFLLVRLPEWSETQSAREVVAAVDQNQSAAEDAAPNNAVTQTPIAPNTAVPKTPKISAPQSSNSQDAELKPPVVAPSPSFPSIAREKPPTEFVAPPLPKLPPVVRLAPKMPNTNSTGTVKPPTTSSKSIAPKATAAPKAAPTQASANNAPVAPKIAAPAAAPVATAGPKINAPKIAVRTAQREVISLRVAPLNFGGNANSRVAAGPSGPNGFMSGEAGAEDAERSDRIADSSKATTSGDAPTTGSAPRTRTGMLRPGKTMASKARVTGATADDTQSKDKAREVTIEIVPPRDLSRARLMVTLAPDWQFSDAATTATSQDTNDASMQREVWKGSANSGQSVRVTLAIQPHFTLEDDNKGGSLRAGKNPLIVELWDVSGPTRKLVASRRLELPAEKSDETDKAKNSAR